MAQVLTMRQTFDQYHIEYLAEQYERLQDLADNKALVSKDKIEVMRRAFKSYDPQNPKTPAL